MRVCSQEFSWKATSRGRHGRIRAGRCRAVEFSPRIAPLPWQKRRISRSFPRSTSPQPSTTDLLIILPRAAGALRRQKVANHASPSRTESPQTWWRRTSADDRAALHAFLTALLRLALRGQNSRAAFVGVARGGSEQSQDEIRASRVDGGGSSARRARIQRCRGAPCPRSRSRYASWCRLPPSCRSRARRMPRKREGERREIRLRFSGDENVAIFARRLQRPFLFPARTLHLVLI
jgi:hypothetical protein